MSSLAQTIEESLDAIGDEPRDVLLETLAAFEGLALPEEERLSAIATAMVATALAHHPMHSNNFLDAVQIWSLEAIETGSAPRLAAVSERPRDGRTAIVTGGEVIASGLNSLLSAMNHGDVPLQDRVIAELTLFTRLLARSPAGAVLATVAAAADRIALGALGTGQPVRVHLPAASAHDREADLMSLPAAGRA